MTKKVRQPSTDLEDEVLEEDDSSTSDSDSGSDSNSSDSGSKSSSSDSSSEDDVDEKMKSYLEKLFEQLRREYDGFVQSKLKELEKIKELEMREYKQAKASFLDELKALQLERQNIKDERQRYEKKVKNLERELEDQRVTFQLQISNAYGNSLVNPYE